MLLLFCSYLFFFVCVYFDLFVFVFYLFCYDNHFLSSPRIFG